MGLFHGNYFRDMQVAISLYQKDYGEKQTKKVALRVAFWNLLYFLQPQSKKIAKGRSHPGETTFAFLLDGGYGDHLLFANWLWYFLDYFKDEDIRVDIYYRSKSAETIFNFPLENVNLINAHKTILRAEEYDVAIEFGKHPFLLHVNEDKRAVGFHSACVSAFVENLYSFYQENRLMLDNKPYLDGMGSARSIAQGKKRIQEGDIGELFGIREEYAFPLEIHEDEEGYLAGLGLEKGCYITVNRGWDADYKGEHMKAWSLKSCGDMIQRIKEKYPDVPVVVIGALREQAPDTTYADYDLVGKTTLEQVKVLLKYSKVHIDNEGGMVHLRHALHGGPSIVLFGPTPVELFGYSENVNLKSDACDIWCEWLTPDWTSRCPRGKEGSPCMEGITSQMVLDEMEKLM